MTKKKLISRVGAGLLAIALLATTFLSLVPSFGAKAAETSTTNGWIAQLNGFATKDELLTQACKLLGKPYGDTIGQKGGDPWHNENGNEVQPYGSGKPGSIQTADKVAAIDCSGLVWWTLTSLGYKTTGFYYNYSVPANTVDWLTTKDTITMEYKGNKAEAKVEDAFTRMDVNVTDKNYWLTEDGETIPGGTIIIADKPGSSAADHAWIYMGEFETRADVIKYITENCGVSAANAEKYVEDGSGQGGKHWRIESSGGKGVTINNRVDAKGASGYKIHSIGVVQDKGSLTITKMIDPAGTALPQYKATKDNYPDYSNITFTIKNSKGEFISATGDNGDYVANETSSNPFTFKLTTEGFIFVDNLDEGEYTIEETTDFDALGLKVASSQKATIKGGENTPVTLINYELEGSIKIIKKSTNVHGVEDATLSSEVKENARFTLYDDTEKMFVNTAKDATTGAYHFTVYSPTPVEMSLSNNGTFLIDKLPADHKYTITETATGANYEIKDATETVTLTNSAPDATVTYYNNRKSANLEVLKYGKTLDGVTYEARIDSQIPGMAALNEAVEFKLKTYTGSYVTATGKDGDYEYLGGADEEGATVFTLDDEGKLKISNLPTSPDRDSKYVLVEINTAKGYKLAEPEEILLMSNTAIPIDNQEEGITMAINKKFILAQIGEDKASDEMYEKCKFVIKNKGGKYLLFTLTDAEKGTYTYATRTDNKEDATVLSLGQISHQSVIESLPLDEYIVEEIVDTSIFTPTETTITVDATTGEDVDITFENEELSGGFSIYKKTASMHNVSGIQFRIYGKSYGGREIDVRTSETDASGFISVNSIPYGEYTIEECGDTVLGCFSVADGQKIVINKPLSEIKPELSFMNELYSGVIKINKATETGKPLQGFEFTIYAEEDIYEGLEIEENLLYKKGEAIEVLVTDVNGNAESTYILPYNYKYTIKETKAIKPYNCDAAPQTIYLERTEENESVYYTVSDKVDVKIKREPNTEYNILVMNKYIEGEKEYEAGDIYVTVTTDENGEAVFTLPAIVELDFEVVAVNTAPIETEKDIIRGPSAQPSTEALSVLNFVDTQQECELTIYKVDDKNEEVKLSGAEFDIIAMEDIYVNNELAYKTGDVITHVVTDENGEAKATLPAGYMVGLKETKAPEGYNLAQDVTSVDLAYDVKLLYTEQSVSVKNGYQMGKLSVYKIDSTNTKKLLEGAEFDVIAKEDITVSGDEHKAGDVIAHIVTDKNGVASVDLWSGYTYLLKETKAPVGYELSDSVTEITIDYNPDILYSETSVSVQNKPKSDVPKTGTSLPIAPVVGAGVLAAAAIGTAIVIKKKED